MQKLVWHTANWEVHETRPHGIFDYNQKSMGKKLGAFWIIAAIMIMQQHPPGLVASFFSLRVHYLFVSLLRAGTIPYISLYPPLAPTVPCTQWLPNIKLN